MSGFVDNHCRLRRGRVRVVVVVVAVDDNGGRGNVDGAHACKRQLDLRS